MASIGMLDEFEHFFYEELSEEQQDVLNTLRREVGYIYRTRVETQNSEKLFHLATGSMLDKAQIHQISLEMVAERYFNPKFGYHVPYEELVSILRFRGLLRRRNRRKSYYHFLGSIVDLRGTQEPYKAPENRKKTDNTYKLRSASQSKLERLYYARAREGVELFLQMELGGYGDEAALSRIVNKHLDLEERQRYKQWNKMQEEG